MTKQTKPQADAITLDCSSSVDALFLRWLKKRLAESEDKQLRDDVLLRINANYRELLLEKR